MYNEHLNKTIKLLIFITTLSSLFIPLTFAQSLINIHLDIKGIVVDSTNQTALSYVTVIVQEKRNLQATKHTLTSDAGTFKINDLAYKEYQLKLSYVGYKTKTITLPPFTSPDIDLGTIALAPMVTELEEVQILTLKPLVEQNGDRITYNIELDPQSNVLNTLDMFRKVPFLTVDGDDNLRLNGNESFRILVNGKRSALFTGNVQDVLKGLPASAIRKVEVSTNPPARYEAEGVGGIINIITKREGISGYNGSVNAGANSPEGYNAGSYITANAGKFNIAGRINNSSNVSPANSSFFYREDLIRETRLEQTGESNSKNRSQSINGEISYDLSSRNNITASYSLNRSRGSNNYKQQVQFLGASKEIMEEYQNLNSGEHKANGQDFNVTYQRSFKKNEAQLLSASFSLVKSNNNGNAAFTLAPVYNYTGRESTSNISDKTEQYDLQADYIQPIGKQTLEMGIKSVFEANSSNYTYKTRHPETGIFLPDSNLSNVFDYRQDIHAAYISLSLKKGKWHLRSGARVEGTQLNANFISSGTGTNKQYLNLFPTVSLSHMLKGTSTLRASYNQRIDRPGLYYLDPYTDLTDPFNISSGNPELSPATTHTVQLEFDTFFKVTSINAGVSHSFTNNSIQQFTTLGSDSVARTTFGNVGQNRNYGLTLSCNTTLFRKLNLSLNSGTNYIAFTSQIEGNMQNTEGFTYYAQGNISYRFGKSWRTSGNLGYNSPNILLQGKAGGYTWSSLAVNKEFLKNNKASINLAVRSPFQKKRQSTTEVTNPGFYQLRESHTEIRQFTLSFNYRFGKLR